jgi:hypothetical protein
MGSLHDFNGASEIEANEESLLIAKLESNGWKDEEHPGHTIYVKGNVAYSTCCQILHLQGGNIDMSRENFENKYLQTANGL